MLRLVQRVVGQSQSFIFISMVSILFEKIISKWLFGWVSNGRLRLPFGWTPTSAVPYYLQHFLLLDISLLTTLLFLVKNNYIILYFIHTLFSSPYITINITFYFKYLNSPNLTSQSNPKLFIPTPIINLPYPQPPLYCGTSHPNGCLSPFIMTTLPPVVFNPWF